MNRTYVDVHVLQTVPPANLNRDDAGSPKQAMYGGARRARVSSQAWKRATRIAFADKLPREELATRTRKVSGLLASRLSARTGLDPEAATRIATHVLEPLAITPGRRASETAYLLFFGREQLERLVGLVAERASELAGLPDGELKQAVKHLPVKEELGSGHPVAVALFGRMVADLPDLNVEAATQVAHALSTHAVEVEFDYFTAVDDENPQAETGAGMIGTVEFNSATLYRFATVGLHQLNENLSGDPDATVSALGIFLDSFVRSMPTGHQNAFAHRTTPGLVSIVVRPDQPVNLVSAFESPVRSTNGTLDESIARLAREMRRADDLWGLPPLSVTSTYASPTDPERARELSSVLGDPMPFEHSVAAATARARERLDEGAKE